MYRHVCIGIDVCIDMCVDVCVDVCTDVCIDMCVDMCVDVCIHVYGCMHQTVASEYGPMQQYMLEWAAEKAHICISAVENAFAHMHTHANMHYVRTVHALGV